MNLAAIPNDSFEVDVRTAVYRQASIEYCSGFAASLADLVGFQRSLDNIGDRPVFAAGESMRQIAGSGTSDGELRFGHVDSFHFDITVFSSAIKMAAAGMLANDTGPTLSYS